MFKFQYSIKFKYLQSNIQSNIAIEYIDYNQIFKIIFYISNMQRNIILYRLDLYNAECHTKQVFYIDSEWDILCSNFVVYNC